jgi:hypothetical protein
MLEHFIMYLLAISEEEILQRTNLFLIGLFILLLNFLSSLYILDIYPLSLNIWRRFFFHSVGSLDSGNCFF